MKMMMKFLLCAGLLQACGQSKVQDSQTPSAASHPDALSDEEIASLEKEAARLENEMHSFDRDAGRYAAYGQPGEELPDLGDSTPDAPADETPVDTGSGNIGGDSGKDPGGKVGRCQERCLAIKDIIKTIKACKDKNHNDAGGKVRDIIKTKKEEIKSKLKACLEKIWKAKKCRDNNGGGKDTPTDGGKDTPTDGGKGKS